MKLRDARELLPSFLRRPLGRVRSYGRRLSIWWSVARHIRGVSETDRRTLRKALMAAPVTSLSDLGRWRDPTVSRDMLADVAEIGRFEIRAEADDLYHVLPTREPAVLRKIRESLRPGDTFVDAGANIGFYTVIASRLVGPEGRVVAVEMMPDTAAILRKHVQMNGATNVEIIEHALSDVAGSEIEARVEEGKFGQASIMRGEGGTVVRVSTVTLDEVLHGVGPVRLMKMDLEGAERAALKGAASVLGRVDAVLFEALPGSDDAAPILTGHGFTVTSLNGCGHFAVRRPRD